MLVGDTSDLDRMMYGGKPVLPEQNSYSVKLPNGTVTSSYSAGLNSQQVQFLNAPYEVSCTYSSLSGMHSAYLQSFFDRHQAQKFIASMIINGTELDEFVVQRIGDVQVKKTGYSGSITVKYQVEPAVDRCWEQSLNDWAECAGDDTAAIWCYADMGVKAWP